MVTLEQLKEQFNIFKTDFKVEIKQDLKEELKVLKQELKQELKQDLKEELILQFKEQDERIEKTLNERFNEYSEYISDLRKNVKKSNTSLENVCCKRLREYISETKPTYIIHSFNLFDEFKLYFDSGREITDLDCVFIIERDILLDDSMKSMSDIGDKNKNLKEYILVIMEVKTIIRQDKIYDKFNQLYSIKQYFEKLKYFLNTYTEDDFKDLNDTSKNVSPEVLFQKYKKQFNVIYNYDENKVNKNKTGDQDKNNMQNKQGDSVKNILYDISNELLYALKNLNMNNILYFFGGDKMHEYSIQLINDFNTTNILNGWKEYNNGKNIRKLDYTDKNQSTIPLTDDFMKSIYKFINNNIGYIDLEKNIVVCNIKEYKVFTGGISLYKKTNDKVKLLLNNKNVIKSVYINKNKTKYINVNKKYVLLSKYKNFMI